MKSIKRFFKLKERNSSIKIEVIAGITTFMTMSYIIFLQPLILSGQLSGVNTGMQPEALIAGVCIASAFGSILMGLWANYPIALAPGMGENFFFLTVISASISLGIAPPESAWQTALGVVFISGIIFLILSFLNVRELMMNAISPSMKYAISSGIGLFIALIGLKNGGIIHTVNGNYLLNSEHFNSATTLIFLGGFISTIILHTLKIKGSIFWGIIFAALLAFLLGKIEFNGIMGTPPSIAPIFCKMDFYNVFVNFYKLLPFIIIFTFMDVFDTLGTLVGVSTQSGLMKDGKLPNAKRAFAADSIGTIFGVFCGQSTVTSYIESSTGVEYGGRTGLTAMTTGVCFIVAMLFTPLISMIAQYPDPGVNPITAPALLIVGAMMIKSVKKIEWDDFTEAIPAFLILIGIPFTFSISDGLTLGFIVYPILKFCGGKTKDTTVITYLLSFGLLLYLMCVKTGLLEFWLK